MDRFWNAHFPFVKSILSSDEIYGMLKVLYNYTHIQYERGQEGTLENDSYVIL